MAPSGAFLAMLGWIVGGWLGLPCFASDSARGVLMGQNAGYIWGYVCAVPMTSFLIRSSAVKKVLFSSAVRIFLCGFLGMLIVYFLGWLRLSSFLGMRNAYKMGICPFVWGDLAKLIAATATTRVFLTIKVKDIDFFNGV
jgi:biotin transport system substrate-specific component